MRRPSLRAAAFAFLLLLAPLSAATAHAAGAPLLPPGEAGAAEALETSPRHGEYVDVPMGKDAPALRCYVVYPERSDKAPVVLVIQEIFGLSPWIKSVADRLAAAGFVAVAPDYLSGLGPGGGGSDSMATRDETVKATRELSPDEVVRRTNAARNWATALPAATPRFGTVGFCWGGSQSFAYAASATPPDAAVVYYGTSPDSAALLRVAAPVLGNYGGDDARVNATIPAAQAALSARKSFYEANVYPGAGHGFLRQQDGREGANLAATQKAWPRTIAFLREHLEKPAEARTKTK